MTCAVRKLIGEAGEAPLLLVAGDRVAPAAVGDAPLPPLPQAAGVGITLIGAAAAAVVAGEAPLLLVAGDRVAPAAVAAAVVVAAVVPRAAP